MSLKTSRQPHFLKEDRTFLLFNLFNFMCVHVCLSLCRFVYVPMEPRRGCQFPWNHLLAVVDVDAGTCKLPDIGPGNWTCVLYKNYEYF